MVEENPKMTASKNAATPKKAELSNASSHKKAADNKPAHNTDASCNSNPKEIASAAATKKQPSHTKQGTKIVVKCNCGFPNNLFLRGEGLPGINWEKGIQMKCTKADEWVWETHEPFTNAYFKVLINDKQYEVGENHSIECGKSISFIPKF